MLQFQIVFSKLVKKNAEAMKVFFGHLQEDSYVVEVDEAIYQIWFPKAILH